jgi:low affinity Fe/Cu permease
MELLTGPAGRYHSDAAGVTARQGVSEPMSSNLRRAWERFAYDVTRWSGRPWAFGFALAVVVLWLLTGPFFGYSDTWQLVINTGTTIVTFLMVFLIQHAQNKDTRAIELKLNELVAAVHGASNRLIDVEELSEEDLDVLQQHYRQLVTMAKREASIRQSHSIDEAEARHAVKRRASAARG